MKMGFLIQFKNPLCDFPGFPARNKGQQGEEGGSGRESSEDLGWAETGWEGVRRLKMFSFRRSLEQQDKNTKGF